MARDALGELEQIMLFALVALDQASEPAYGASILRLIEEETRRSVSPGALHTGYERLQRRGFVSSRLGEPSPVRGGRRKRLYELTPSGAKALRASYQRVSAMAEGRLQLLDELAE